MATAGPVEDGHANHCSLQRATQCLFAGYLQAFAMLFGRLVHDFIQVDDYVQLACWYRSLLESNS